MAVGFAKQKAPPQRTNFGKGKSAGKFPAKKPGAADDKSKPRKALFPKKK